MNSSDELPTKLHRGAAAFLLLGFALLLASLPLELGVLRKGAVVTLLVSICAVLAADLYQMLATGAGFGRLGRGVVRSSSPASFWLHIVIRVILLVLFVLPLLVYAMR